MVVRNTLNSSLQTVKPSSLLYRNLACEIVMHLILICLLPTMTLAAISNILVIESNICRVTNRKYWDLMEWFFGRTSNVYVTHIAEHPDDTTNHFYPDVFMKAILKSDLISN